MCPSYFFFLLLPPVLFSFCLSGELGHGAGAAANGAVYLSSQFSSSSTILDDCVIEFNTAIGGDGGAIGKRCILSDGCATLNQQAYVCTIGGAVLSAGLCVNEVPQTRPSPYLFAGDLEFRNCSISHNLAAGGRSMLGMYVYTLCITLCMPACMYVHVLKPIYRNLWLFRM